MAAEVDCGRTVCCPVSGARVTISLCPSTPAETSICALLGFFLKTATWLAIAMATCACTDPGSDTPSLIKDRGQRRLALGEFFPEQSEKDAAGSLSQRIKRDSPAFRRLVRCDSSLIVFKDEEGTGADRMMTPRLETALAQLSKLVRQQWPGISVRVTEAWDESGEHGSNSLHYEGRAADITASDLDPTKLGRVGALAVQAGFDWVFYEDPSHLHVSVRR